jgi:SWI/SNF-related matrix-associated actin-dependent regulator 1 of chromatin subfamily A
MADPLAGQRIRFEVPVWLAQAENLASRELEGEVLAVTPKGIQVTAHAVIRESQWCLKCGQEIVNPVSRLVGYGPICSDKLGIPRPDKLDPAQIRALRAQVEKATIITKWFPRSKVTIKEITGAAKPQAAAAPGPAPRRIIDHNGSQFVVKINGEPEIRVVLKSITGTRWHGDTKSWLIPTEEFEAVGDVAKLPFGWEVTPEAQAVIDGAAAELAASSAITGDLVVPGLGGKLRPFQAAGVKYMADKKRVICGDQMGLGKTIEALATVQYLGTYPALVVCPASVKLNWRNDARFWLPGKSVRVIDATTKRLPRADVVIINYDILSRWEARLTAAPPSALILDESHYIKNGKAQRSKATKLVAKAIREAHGDKAVLLALTGTAIMNRVMELPSQLDAINRLNDFGGFRNFVVQYGKADTTQLRNLNRKLRQTCYLRREKSDVLTELPPKQRSFIPVSLTNRETYDEAARDLIGFLRREAVRDREFRRSLVGLPKEEQMRLQSERADSAAERALRAEHLVRVNKLKRLVAQGKLRHVIQWVEDFLAEGDEKLVLFGWHQEFVDAIATHFKCPSITGATPNAKRQQAVEAFQNDSRVRLIALNLSSGGIGLTLTAASNVLTCELGWSPSTHEQAEDRCHRIGQASSVNAWYIIAENTIEQKIYDLIEAKRGIVEAVLIGTEGDVNSSVFRDLMEDLQREALGG